jgi:hypothetical protein
MYKLKDILAILLILPVALLLSFVASSFILILGTRYINRTEENTSSITRVNTTYTDWYSDRDSVLVITTARQLKEFSQLVNSGTTFRNKIIRLGNNIRLNDTTGWRGWDSVAAVRETWVPIGTRSTPFKGTFDGQGYIVSGLYIHTGTEGFYQGLFGYIEGAIIRNLGIESSCIKAYEYVGAVAGFISSGSTISGCYNNGVVTGERNLVGGVVGCCDGINTVINCYNTGTVTGKRYVGGITGSFQNGSIYNCCNSGAVTGKYEDIGGIIGYRGIFDLYYTKGNHADTLANCYNTGMVRGRDVIGGIAGCIGCIGDFYHYDIVRKAKRAFFANCYNTGKLISAYPVVTDGLIGAYGWLGNRNDVYDWIDNHRGGGDTSTHTIEDNGVVDVIERYGDVCYWATEVCTIPVLEIPRFSRNLRSDFWIRYMPYQRRSPHLFKSVPGRYLQSAEFVTALNNWVDKKQGPYKRWVLDTLDVNRGYPVFEGRPPAKL